MTAQELEKKYEIKVKELSLFSKKFDVFVKQSVKNYPSDKTRKLQAVSSLLTEILTNDDVNFTNEKKVDEVYKIFSDVLPKVEENTNGFNMDDVLNPKEDLDLMSLCKELGVTD